MEYLRTRDRSTQEASGGPPPHSHGEDPGGQGLIERVALIEHSLAESRRKLDAQDRRASSIKDGLWRMDLDLQAARTRSDDLLDNLARTLATPLPRRAQRPAPPMAAPRPVETSPLPEEKGSPPAAADTIIESVAPLPATPAPAAAARPATPPVAVSLPALPTPARSQEPPPGAIHPACRRPVRVLANGQAVPQVVPAAHAVREARPLPEAPRHPPLPLPILTRARDALVLVAGAMARAPRAWALLPGLAAATATLCLYSPGRQPAAGPDRAMGSTVTRNRIPLPVKATASLPLPDDGSERALRLAYGFVPPGRGETVFDSLLRSRTAALAADPQVERLDEDSYLVTFAGPRPGSGTPLRLAVDVTAGTVSQAEEPAGEGTVVMLAR